MVEIDVSAVQLHIGRYAECECKRVSVRKRQRQGKWMRERERERGCEGHKWFLHKTKLRRKNWELCHVGLTEIVTKQLTLFSYIFYFIFYGLQFKRQLLVKIKLCKLRKLLIFLLWKVIKCFLLWSRYVPIIKFVTLPMIASPLE